MEDLLVLLTNAHGLIVENSYFYEPEGQWFRRQHYIVG